MIENIVANTNYYYKIEAVSTNVDNQIEHVEVLTDTLTESGINPAEIPDRTGNKDYLAYYEYSTPTGNGTIENSSGNLSYTQEDATLPTNHLDFDVTRYYNSQNTAKGMFGIGWTDSLHKEIIRGTNGTICMVDSDGAGYVFTNQSGEYRCKQNSEYTVTDTVGTILGDEYCYTLKTKDGIFYHFNQHGQMIYKGEPNGTYLYYSYGDDGRLAEVSSETGKKITFTYYATGVVKAIQLPDETILSYNYFNGQINKMQHSSSDGSQSIFYIYTYNGNKLIGVTDAEGHNYEFTYSGTKASKVTYPNGESYTLTYNTNKTSVSKKNEDEVTLYSTSAEYDSQTGKILKETDADGNVTNYTYSYAANPYLVTGTSTQSEYEVIENGKIVIKQKTETTSTSYNADENVEEEVAEDGTVTTYTYPTESQATEWTKDQPTEIVSTLDETLISSEEIIYDELGNVTNEVNKTDENNLYETSTIYDENGNIETTITLENDVQTQKSDYTYDEEGNILSESSISGDMENSDSNSYDIMGRVLKSIDKTVDGDTKYTEYTYDYLGRVIQTSDTVEGVTQNSFTIYDDNGTVLSETDASGITTTYEYDSINRLVKRTVTKGSSTVHVTSYSYGNVTIQEMAGTRTVTNAYIEENFYPNGDVQSTIYYDKNGQVVREEADGIYTDYTYDLSGNQICAYTNGVQSPASAGKRVVTLYDENGRQTHTVINPTISGGEALIGSETIVTSQEYDDQGNVVKETDAKGVSTAYEYDDSSRVTKVTEAFGTDAAISVTAQYSVEDDASGDENCKQNTITITDALGNQSIDVLDASGLTKQTIDYGDNAGESIINSYEYNENGNQTKVTYGNGSYRVDVYDNSGVLTESNSYDVTDTQTLQTEYTYVELFRQISMVDKKLVNGTLTPYRYTYTDYDELGRVAWVSEVSSQSTPSATVIDNHKIHYVYDTEDKIQEIQYALVDTGEVESLHFEYNSYRWLTAVKAKIKGSEGKKLLRSYTYDNCGKVSVINEYPNFATGGTTCITKTYSYDVFDRVISMIYKKGTVVLEEYTYQYDKNDHIIQKTEKNLTSQAEADRTHVTKTYTYDVLGQLIQTEITDHRSNNAEQTISYTYDKVGNRTKQVDGNEETVYTYNGLNQLLTAVTEKNDVIQNNRAYTYDDSGNQIQETDSVTGITITNQYDTENRLIKVSNSTANGTVVQENVYNGNGQRIQKKEGSDVTNYFYQDGVVSYTTGTDTEEKDIQNLLGLEGNVIAAEINELVNSVTEVQYFLYNKDIQGSTSSILDELGNGKLSYEYDDFGETEIHGTSNLDNEICYTGSIYDESIGHYYLNARYYNPANGRFLSQDTYRGEVENPYTLHLYTYCKNDPVNYVDPSGHARKKKGKYDLGSFMYGWFVEASIDSKGIRKQLQSKNIITKGKGIKKFINYVKTNGKYDIKNTKEYKDIRKYAKKHNKNIYFRKRKMRKDDPGNIIFGFFAGSCGFSLQFSQMGAGIYQIISGTSKLEYVMSYGDDPRDSEMIKWGHNIYKKEKNNFVVVKV